MRKERTWDGQGEGEEVRGLGAGTTLRKWRTTVVHGKVEEVHDGGELRTQGRWLGKKEVMGVCECSAGWRGSKVGEVHDSGRSSRSGEICGRARVQGERGKWW
ncbi:hypothetical protein AMTR_s00015p00164050 [Amborella trichopoda]|uniref:Uncharacterized protein n=1 Tax=Amborella trichopoda TaxID=13333 RepID=W1PNV5_AMBTC|nr:hypothetical protein AMTR_s00015p00164050 [Amborella trichopoda]